MNKIYEDKARKDVLRLQYCCQFSLNAANLFGIDE